MTNQDRGLDALVEQIRRDRGFDGSQYKQSFLKRRLAVRMRARGVDSFGEYQALLNADADEYPRLMSALTINLSYFFRDGDVFLSIRGDILQPLIQQRSEAGRRRLDIWSAGCAGGEEPYSIAIMLWELLGSELSRWRLKILATDIDDEALRKAGSGKFNDFSFRGVSDEFLRPYFIRQGEYHLIRPDLKQLVTFRRHNLMSDTLPDAAPFDLILCRNVLIYLSRERQAQILSLLHRALRQEGHLVLGKTEIPQARTADLFRATHPRLHIYAKSKQEFVTGHFLRDAENRLHREGRDTPRY